MYTSYKLTYDGKWQILTHVLNFPKLECRFAHHKKKQHIGKEPAVTGVFQLVQAGDDAEKPFDGTRDWCLM